MAQVGPYGRWGHAKHLDGVVHGEASGCLVRTGWLGVVHGQIIANVLGQRQSDDYEPQLGIYEQLKSNSSTCSTPLARW